MLKKVFEFFVIGTVLIGLMVIVGENPVNDWIINFIFGDAPEAIVVFIAFGIIAALCLLLGLTYYKNNKNS